MYKLFFSLFILLLTCSMVMHSADGKRFGSGKNFGIQRSVNNNNYFRNTNSTQYLPNQQQKSFGNKWLGPLAGFAAGGLLASLFMGHGGAGIGGSLISWILLAGAGIFIWNLLRRYLQQPATQPLHNNSFMQDPEYNSSSNFSSAPSAAVINFPSGFQAETFLRDAKAKFIRLQTAFDNKNLNDIREFTSPEVFAEIQLQIQERGDQQNQTEIITLNAELLEYTTEPQNSVATVRFTGSIREDNNHAEQLNEIWHFKQNINSNWIVAGVQQSAS